MAYSKTCPLRNELQPKSIALDPEALKSLVLAQQSELASQQTEIENLKLLIFKLKRMQAHRSPIAAEALERIGQLYGIEKEIRGRLPGERQQIRANRARPLLDSMQTWFKATLAKLSRKSDVALAINYAVGRWAALVRYCEDGNIEIDNNAAERALRGVALGRKNYLFAGSDAGGSARLRSTV